MTAEQWGVVAANTGLVKMVLSRMRRTRPEDWDDAYQDGLFGLMRAAQKFDPRRGVRFSTYAVPHVRQAVMRGRGRALGRNYRRAVDAGLVAEWSDPASLDALVSGADDVTLAGVIQADEDTEGDALARATFDAAARRLERACRDDVDRAAAARVLGFDQRSREEVVPALGISRETLRLREKRLRGLVQEIVS